MEHQTQIEFDSCVAACIAMVTGVDQKHIYDNMKIDPNGSGLDGELRQWVRLGYLPTVLQSTRLDNPLVQGKAVLATVPSLHYPGGNHRIIIDMTEDPLEVLDPSKGRPDAKVYTRENLGSWSELTIVEHCGVFVKNNNVVKPWYVTSSAKQAAYQGWTWASSNFNIQNSWGPNWGQSPSPYIAPSEIPEVFTGVDLASGKDKTVGSLRTSCESPNVSNTSKAKEYNHDVDADLARTLHRVVRAMHDGHCYNCGHLGSSDTFEKLYRAELVGHKCPECSFFITEEETDAALKLFQPYGTKALKVFTDWSKQRSKDSKI